MSLKNLLLRNFRNYSHLEVSFHPKANLISGRNGQGKTNLIEAVNLISTGRSFRTVHLVELIKKGEKYFCIEAEFEKDGVSQSLKLFFDGKTRKMQYNHSVFPSFTNLLGLLPSVMHSPLDMKLIIFPAARRRFLNLHLAQQDPLYVYHFSRFLRAMKQRNLLLKKESAEIVSFESEMSKAAYYITLKRKEMLEDIKSHLKTYLQELSSNYESANIYYLPSITNLQNYQQRYSQQLKDNRYKDAKFNTTLQGPHRDDFSIFIEDKPAKNFASEGQKKSFTLALRLAEWQRLCHSTEQALITIDDLDSHLDMERQKLLKKVLTSFSQVFITTPLYEKEAIEGKQIIIESGKLASIF